MKTNSRYVCLQAVSPNSPIYGMESRSKPRPSRCITTRLDQMFAFAFSHFSFIGHVLNKILWESVETYIGVTHMTNTGLVYSPVRNVYTAPTVFSSPSKCVNKSSVGQKSSCQKPVKKCCKSNLHINESRFNSSLGIVSEQVA